MNKFLILLFTSIFALPLLGQNGSPVYNGGRTLGMGNTGVVNKDLTSVYSNQAGLAYITSMQGGVFGSRRFMIADINSLGVAFAYPTASGTFGLDVNSFGFESFKQQSVGLNYGRKLFDKLAIGGKILVNTTAIPEYGNTATFSFALGFYSRLLDKVHLAGHLFNPIRSEIAPNENLATNLRIGLTYFPSKKTTLNLEAEQNLDYDMRIKAGVEYQMIKQFFIRFGVQTEPVQASFGIGFDIDYLKIDVASQYHQVLGFTPGISVIYVGKPNKKLK